jgi:antitoxin (DNA-binding transcriptional repressor) of toxin-antitoxin stability system
MDAVEHGQSFTVTRDGHRIGELIPLRRRRFVSREEFTAMSRNAPDVDLEAFRADQDAAADHRSSRSRGRPDHTIARRTAVLLAWLVWCRPGAGRVGEGDIA